MHVLCICLNLQLWLGFRITAFHWGGYTPSSRSVVLPRRLCESVSLCACVRACIRVYWSPDFWLCRVTNPCNRLRSYAFEPATASVRGRRGAGHLSVKRLSMFKNGDLHLNVSWQYIHRRQMQICCNWRLSSVLCCKLNLKFFFFKNLKFQQKCSNVVLSPVLD